MDGKQTIKLSEKQFQQQVVHLAQLYGWKVYHTYDSRHSEKGYPDLCLLKGTRLMYAELKKEDGKVTPEQQEWLNLLKASGKPEVYLWRPSNWPEIQEVLTR